MADQKLETSLELSLSLDEAERNKSQSLDIGFDSETNRWELIIRYSGNLILPEAISMVPLYGGYAILSVPEVLLDSLSSLPQIEYIEMPRKLELALSSSRATACINVVQAAPLSLTGKGVLVGIVDSGIDIFHPDFQNEDGTTRILELWDQTLDDDGTSGYLRGRVFTSAQINQALRDNDRSFPSRDLSGHGTHVAGIAAGNGRASDGAYRGVATESSLLVVKLGNPSPTGFPRTTELMLAMDYCVRKAIELGSPLALNISFGNNYGSHDGNSLLETYIDDLAGLGRTVIAIGSGNEGGKGRHASGTLVPGTPSQIEFAVADGERSLNLQIWKNYSDRFQIRLVSPVGEEVVLSEQTTGSYRAVVDNTQLFWFFGSPSPYRLAQEIYIEMVPTDSQTYIQSGIWKLQLTPIAIVDGVYRLWLPGGNSINPSTAFLVPSELMTLTIPSTASKPITVAAYNSRSESFALFSGQGFTGTGQPKPDLAAPGVDIMSTAPGGGYTANTGTSMATPFVTGSASLLMEYGIIRGNDPYLYGQKVKAYLLRGARRPAIVQNYPSPAIGWGLLCLKDSIP